MLRHLWRARRPSVPVACDPVTRACKPPRAVRNFPSVQPAQTSFVGPTFRSRTVAALVLRRSPASEEPCRSKRSALLLSRGSGRPAEALRTLGADEQEARRTVNGEPVVTLAPRCEAGAGFAGAPVAPHDYRVPAASEPESGGGGHHRRAPPARPPKLAAASAVRDERASAPRHRSLSLRTRSRCPQVP